MKVHQWVLSDQESVVLSTRFFKKDLKRYFGQKIWKEREWGWDARVLGTSKTKMTDQECHIYSLLSGLAV